MPTAEGIRTDDTGGGVRIVWFDRPRHRNAMTLETFRAHDALLDADASPAVRAVVVTGAGDWFCSGADPAALDALLDLLLSGRKITADEAARLGLAQRVLPRDEVLPAALAYATELAAHCSPASMAVIRRQVWSGLDSTADQAVTDAMRLMAESFGRPDFHEAVDAMRTGRRPAFPAQAPA